MAPHNYWFLWAGAGALHCDLTMGALGDGHLILLSLIMLQLSQWS